MAYVVVKHINGKDYLYRQSSFRDGGKVKTSSAYLCPVAPALAGQLRETGGRIDAVLSDTSEQNTPDSTEPLIIWREIDSETKALWVDRKTGEVLKEKTSVFNKSEATATPAKKVADDSTRQIQPAPSLNIAAKVERHHISRDAVNGAYQKFCVSLAESGLNTTNLQPIRIGYSFSGKVELGKRMFGGYRVAVPYLKRSGVVKAMEKPPDRRTRAGKAKPRIYKEPSKCGFR